MHWCIYKIGVGKGAHGGFWGAIQGAGYTGVFSRKSSLSRTLICTYDLCIYLSVCMLYFDKKLTKSNSRGVVDMSPYAFLVPEVEAGGRLLGFFKEPSPFAVLESSL